MKNNKNVKETIDRRAYKILTIIDQNPYVEESWSTHKTFAKEGMKGRKKKNKYLYRFQYREYRTWKYNRKTQWKSTL